MILSMNSPIFRTLFQNKRWVETQDPEMSEIIMEDCKPEVFFKFLQYIYQRKIKDPEKNIYELYQIGEKFCTFELQEYCSKYFEKVLNIHNCIQHYEKCCDLGLNEWKRDCLEYLEKKSRSLTKELNCFLGLREETVQEILKLDSLSSPEIHLFRALVRWAKGHVKKLGSKTSLTVKDYVEKHLHLIDISLMGWEELDELRKTGYFKIQSLLRASLNLSKKLSKDVYIGPRSGSKYKKMKVLLLSWHRRGNDRQAALASYIKSGGIGRVDTCFVDSYCPSVRELEGYDAIVLRSANTGSLNCPEQLGNYLAETVEKGVGLVVFAINTLINSDDKKIKGRIYNDNFIPLTYGERIEKSQCQLGTIHSKDHPIMNGVQSFACKTYAHVIDSANINNGNLIASWDNGYPLITEKQKNQACGSVVVINTHPISTATTNDCGKAWLQETDGLLLISNSVKYVAQSAKQKITKF
eukprot:Anaeramoba_flamelloidesc37972_g2_i1.p1 GENE.c37972_g2_i1~~c37972_g2_i1.p1  ORF type:complete len:468 (+),score=105.27 c37972_g2_i1:632-2035(+)